MLGSFTSNEALQNTRARFSDAGAWAVHYSTVRMGLSTFFITAAWGLVTLKWTEYSAPLWWTAWGVWALAAIFLLLFSALLAHASGRQEIYKAKLVSNGAEAPPSRFLPIWVPLIIFLVMSVGFYFLMKAWPAQQSPPKTALVDGTTADTVKFSGWEGKLDHIGKSLDRIHAKLAQPILIVTPSPSPSATPTASPRAVSTPPKT